MISNHCAAYARTHQARTQQMPAKSCYPQLSYFRGAPNATVLLSKLAERPTSFLEEMRQLLALSMHV